MRHGGSYPSEARLDQNSLQSPGTSYCPTHPMPSEGAAETPSQPLCDACHLLAYGGGTVVAPAPGGESLVCGFSTCPTCSTLPSEIATKKCSYSQYHPSPSGWRFLSRRMPSRSSGTRVKRLPC